MRKYDYSFLKKDIPGKIVGLTDIIADLKSKEEFRKLQYSDTFESLRKKAIIESVKGSNAIEGIVTTDSRIREIVANATPITHDELEISGYKDALNLIYTEYSNLEIEEDTICMFHKMIEEHTNTDAVGIYKKNNNFIMEYNPDETQRVRFKPINARETKAAMEQLILSFYEARQDSEIASLLPIPCFIVDFLCIPPFNDGNGRVSRLLTVLLLYSFGYDIVRYICAIVPVSKQDIAEKVPDISIKTIELVLSKMVKENKITKIGSYKDARYMRKNDK